MKNSCGALFYTFDPNGNIGIVLGLEQGEWLPFKGCNEEGETFMETAIREIQEETCGLVKIQNITLDHKFTSKRKHYYIGICEVPYDIIEQFNLIRQNEKRKEYMEKEELKFFNLDTIMQCKEIHNISKASINYFMNKLLLLNTKDKPIEYNRKHSINALYVNDQLDNQIEQYSSPQQPSHQYPSHQYPSHSYTNYKTNLRKLGGNYLFNQRYYQMYHI